jgi:hypothetical protein
MEEHQLILPKATEGRLYYVLRARQACLRMSDDAAPLPPFRLQLPIHEIEVLAAVVDLTVIVSHSLPISENRRVLGPAVAYARQVLREMNGRIRVMPNPQQ